MTGGEQRKLSGSFGYLTVRQNQIAQAIRTLVNEVETDLAALHAKASRAYGTYNTTAFGTAADFSDFANSHKILDDNGAPQGDRSLIIVRDSETSVKALRNACRHRATAMVSGKGFPGYVEALGLLAKL